MFGSKRNSLRFFLALVFALGFVGNSHVEASSDVSATDLTVGAREIIFKVKVNKLVDRHIDALDQILTFVNSPILDDVKRQLTWHIYLLLNNGYLRSLTNLKRTGDCLLVYRKKTLTLDFNLGWDDVIFDYKYLARMLLVKKTGDLIGHVYDLKVNVILDFDFNTYEVRLRRLDFVDSGKIDIKLEGKLVDQLYNLIIKSITTICRSLVLKSLESEYTKTIEHRIAVLNAILGKGSRPLKFVNMLPQNH